MADVHADDATFAGKHRWHAACSRDDVLSPTTFGPRERALLSGYESVGDGDLLAILLGVGRPGLHVTRLAADLLAASGGLLGLARGGLAEGADALLIGKAQRARIEAGLELGKRTCGVAAFGRRRPLSGPAEVAAWARAEMGAALNEELWVVAVDAHHAVMGVRRVATGTATECRFSVRDVLRTVLRLGAHAFFLVHNHPSGHATPSPDDIEATTRIAEAARAVGLVLLDHVVVTDVGHQSMFALGFLDPRENPSR